MGPGLLALIPAAEARRRLLDAARPLGTETVAVDGAAVALLHRIVATDVHAQESIPSFARSAVDGYAVQSAGVAAASGAQPVRLRCVSAGDATAIDTAFPIATGGAVPPGADAVLMVEHVRREADALVVTTPIAKGRNVIAVGEDVSAGAVLVGRGRRLNARDLALMGAAGVASVPVVRRPRIAVLSSGAELVELGSSTLAPAAVRDVNQPALVAASRACGAVHVTGAGIVPDDSAAIATRIAALAADHDLVIVSGGTSVGRADYTADALERLGARLLFHGAAMRPGRPTLAATLGPAVILGLPGVSAAAITIFAVFVRPFIARLCDAVDDTLAPVAARISSAVGSSVDREDYVRVRLEDRAGTRWAHPLPGTSSSLLALASADGLAIIPAEIAAVAAGDLVQVLRF